MVMEMVAVEQVYYKTDNIGETRINYPTIKA